MTMNTRWFLLTCLSLALLGCGGGDSDSSSSSGGSSNGSSGGGEDEPFGLTSRPDPNLPFGEQPTDPDTIGFQSTFTNLEFSAPILFKAVPGTNRNVVLEKDGMIYIFDNSPSVESRETYLDITSVVRSGDELGLLGLAFAPDYEQSGHVFIHYNAEGQGTNRCSQSGLCSVISRFTRNASGVLDPNSGVPFLRVPQPFGNHNGGSIEFGEGNELYIAIGDGGSGNDPDNHSQNRTNMLGKILRIDVSGDSYTIPPGNPFVGLGNESDGLPGEGNPIRQEIWAYGLRNPFRFSIDKTDNTLWIGDVGQDAFEEVNRVPNYSDNTGLNFGWRVFEGNERRDPNNSTDSNVAQLRELTPPLLAVERRDARSLIGGIVYRGSEHSHLNGAYIYGDNETGNVWALRQSDGQVTENSILSTSGFGVAGFGEDQDGELYMTKVFGTNSQHVQRLVNSGDVEPIPPPASILQTGIFSDIDNLTPATGVIPYDVNLPFWSDRTVKQRWVAIPENSRIVYSEDGEWEFPIGSVLIKQLDLHLNQVEPSNLKRMETRILVHYSSGWEGFTYRWNDEGTDANLLTDRTTTTINVTTESGVEEQTYTFPGSADCTDCHNGSDGAGEVLGIRTHQLNKDYDYGQQTDNQIRSWNNVEFFANDANTSGDLPQYYAPDDESASLEQRARSYLAVNCSFCHNPDPINSQEDMDLRIGTATENILAINVPPIDSSVYDGLENPLLIDPGNKENSAIWLRLSATPDSGIRMPPEYSHVPDPVGVELIGRWIDSLN